MAWVLLADTSTTMRIRVLKAVEGYGHRVEEMSNGREVLEICENSPPNCLVLDVVLPGLDGIKVLRRIQKQSLGVPTVVLTDVRMRDIEEKCRALGASHFLRKSTPIPKIAQVVDDVVRENLKTSAGADSEKRQGQKRRQ